MRLVPRTIAGRLAVASVVVVLIGLIVSAVGIWLTLSHFVRGQVDLRLDGQINGLAAVVEVDGGDIRLERWVDAVPFDGRRSGWYWQIRTATKTLRSEALGSIDLVVPDPRYHGPLDVFALRPISGDAEGPDGRPLYVRFQNRLIDGVPVQFVASAPTRALTGPLVAAVLPAAGTLLVLGLALTAASILQVRVGLRPLKALATAVGEVRAARRERLPEEGQPGELKPLVAELNRLITDNAEGLVRARSHAANLGHALNTPLASLALSLSESDRPDDAERLELVRRLQDRIRHHLGRARMAALSGAPRARTDLARHVGDLLDALGKIHAERGIVAVASIPQGLAVACDPQDLDEMVGNLLDNAFKWARSKVDVTASVAGGTAEIVIADDGPGLEDAELERAVMPGQRLDESVPGTGFGLPIARELAELSGGSLSLRRSALGGLAVTLWLPLPPAA